MDEIFMQLCGSLGAPVAFSYILYKLIIAQQEQISTIVRDNTKAINKLAVIIAKIEGKIDLDADEEKEREEK